MSGPFRDLFVELPRALFETLQQVGEAAVIEAQPVVIPPPIEEPKTSTLEVFENLAPFFSQLAARYDRRFVRIVREWDRGMLAIVVRLACGHAHRIRIDEIDLVSRPGPLHMVDVIIDAFELDADIRSCTCIPFVPRCESCSQPLGENFRVTPLWQPFDLAAEFSVEPVPLTTRHDKPDVIRTCTRSGCIEWAKQKQAESRDARWVQ